MSFFGVEAHIVPEELASRSLFHGEGEPQWDLFHVEGVDDGRALRAIVVLSDRDRAWLEPVLRPIARARGPLGVAGRWVPLEFDQDNLAALRRKLYEAFSRLGAGDAQPPNHPQNVVADLLDLIDECELSGANLTCRGPDGAV